MIIVITPEQLAENEIKIVTALFHEGADRIHLRKYQLDKIAMAKYIQQIPTAFHPRLVLHHHHDLAADFEIKQLHRSEQDRLATEYKVEGLCYSTSTHSIDTFNALNETWDYAFLSPFFPSISKPGYGNQEQVIDQLTQRTNRDVKLIALGGLHTDNVSESIRRGADGIALLGTIWQSPNPVKQFRACQTKFVSTIQQ
ncbi:thiamine phosphate synthase [Sphingobacterium corticis]|uniref:Thiamine phosphate synthase n=1 Tax=Sphingobacterium corticis TaxID=1812823 RepID=A0ABW5NL27_9SPHI